MQKTYIVKRENKKVAPGGRFELPFPYENALCGMYSYCTTVFPGARPTRLGDPGTNLAIKVLCKIRL